MVKESNPYPIRSMYFRLYRASVHQRSAVFIFLHVRTYCYFAKRHTIDLLTVRSDGQPFQNRVPSIKDDRRAKQNSIIGDFLLSSRLVRSLTTLSATELDELSSKTFVDACRAVMLATNLW